MKIRKILIPATELVENHTIYYIEVYIREYSWLVTRRYKEFYEVHEKLVKKHGVDHSLLPPKKYFGSLKPEYVEKRRQALESYFEMLLCRFEDDLPQEVLEFIQTDRYDVCGVTNALANELFTKGDEILTKEEQFTLSPLQLHCITSRLGMAVPTCDSHSPHAEIGNLYDFIYQLKHLRVSGGKKQVELSDNITLKCNLSIFKSLETLEISCCDVEPFEGLNFVQNHVKKLAVHHSVHLLKDILVDDEIWEQGVLESVDERGIASFSPTSNFRAWKLLTEADFSENDLPYIDESVALLPDITSLILSHNCIDSIEHLQALSNLVDLDLSHNNISSLGNNLNTKLGNVKRLNLAGNQLDSVEGLDKLFSLISLNLSENILADIGSVLTLGELPCLEMLDLTGNALTKAAMYRVRIFTAFEDRAKQLQLDGHRPSTREMNRIRELLLEEQNFEIINYPTPPQYPKPKQGHKKVKSVDRVIALDSGTDIQSSVSSADSNSFMDDTDAEFRSRVEKIRQQGGDGWLRIFDEIQGEEEMTQFQESGKEEAAGSESQVETTSGQLSLKNDSVSVGDTSLTSQEEEARTLRANSEVHSIDKETAGAVNENEADPCRLQFGFAPELEKVLHEKMESNAEVTSGTYMVEVEEEDHHEGGAEERMVGVDLCKGLIFEIQITTGKTCAKHNLEDISSVDILKLGGAFCVDIRDIYSKEWRRHRSVFSDDDSSVSAHTKDYRQVARYRMRSIEDAAELFALLYKFITEKSVRATVPVTIEEPLPGIFSGDVVEWPNPLGIQQDILHRFFEDFLLEPASNISPNNPALLDHKARASDRPRTKKVQTVYQALHEEFIDVGCLRHDRSGTSPEMVRFVLWSGCLPYLCPEYELPVCLLMTNVNIYLFHSSHLDTPANLHLLKTSSDLSRVLQCFYSFPVRELNEVVFGLYDQGFRMEVKQDGPRGTFTILTRDAEKTDKFLVTLRDILGEPLTEGHSVLARRISRQFSSGSLPKLKFPDEEKINKLKDELAKSESVAPKDNQHLLMYSIVREVPDWASLSVQESGDLTKMLRSLIVTNSEIFLCDEDHVHWPLPSFVRAPPSTPQWVVTRSQEISRIIGIDVFELGGNVCEFMGVFGLSLIFEPEESESTSADEQNCWHLIFRAADERTQLQRSLSQVWKDSFQADLKVTYSKPKSLPGPQDDYDLLGLQESISSMGAQTPVGTPVDQKFKKTHRRVGSDSLPIFKPTMLNSLESLVTLDRKVLDSFFHKWISQKDKHEDETLLHVLWTGCTPFFFPSLEIKVCVLLSNLFIYILADKEHKIAINKRAGIKLRISEGVKDAKPTICFNFIAIHKLRQVCVGLFDQTFRLETELKEDTFTFITRDFNHTSAFLDCLNAILSPDEHRKASPDPNADESLPGSIYDSTSITDRHPKAEYQHTRSGVRFVYPNDDTLEILKDAIAGSSPHSNHHDVTILVYLLVFHETEPGNEESRTLVIMDKSLCLCIEDHVNYPLPLFATGLPNHPQYEVQDLRDIALLSRVEFSDFNSCDFNMVFSPTRFQEEDVPDGFDSASMGELCVITHLLPDPGDKDVCWRIVAQTYEEKEKALSLICKLWADIHGGALPVMKAKS